MEFEKIKQDRNESKTFATDIGVNILEVKENYAKGEILIKKEHLNVWGTVHGGCIFSLADSISGVAAISNNKKSVTLSANINYLAPAVNTEKIIAEAFLVKSGKTISVYDVFITNDKNKKIATSVFTYYTFNDSSNNDSSKSSQ